MQRLQPGIMKHRQQQRVRTLPPVIAAIFLALVGFSFSVNAIISEGYIQPETAEPTETTTATPEVTPESESEYCSLIGSRDWDEKDSRILLKIAMAEAEGESVEGKALIMLVVLNRVWSDDFPGTIEEVVFQDGQFSPTKDGGRYWTTEPNKECCEALELVTMGWDESFGALYFESSDDDSWHSKNLELVFEYGSHRFYK